VAGIRSVDRHILFVLLRASQRCRQQTAAAATLAVSRQLAVPDVLTSRPRHGHTSSASLTAVLVLGVGIARLQKELNAASEPGWWQRHIHSLAHDQLRRQHRDTLLAIPCPASHPCRRPAQPAGVCRSDFYRASASLARCWGHQRPDSVRPRSSRALVSAGYVFPARALLSVWQCQQ
jgi:hypothetical protein